METHRSLTQVEGPIRGVNESLASVPGRTFARHVDFYVVLLFAAVWLLVIGWSTIHQSISVVVTLDETMGDQAQYVSAARSFLEQGRLVDAQGRPFTLYPIGLPLGAASLGSVLGLSGAFSLINAVSVIVVAVCTLGIARALGLPRVTAVLTAIIVLTSPVVLAVSEMVWTEAAFAATIAVFVLLATRVANRAEISHWELVPLLGAVGLATTLKYVGVVLIPVLGYLVWWVKRRRGTRAAAWACAAMAVSSLPTVAMVVRNLALGDGPFGNRTSAYLRLDDAISTSLQEFGLVLISPQTSQIYRSVGVALFVICGISILWIWREQSRAGYLLWGVFLSYWVLLWLSQASTHVDPTGPRFLMPMVAPIVLLTVYWLEEASQDVYATGQARGSKHLSFVTHAPPVIAVAWTLLNVLYLLRSG